MASCVPFPCKATKCHALGTNPSRTITFPLVILPSWDVQSCACSLASNHKIIENQKGKCLHVIPWPSRKIVVSNSPHHQDILVAENTNRTSTTCSHGGSAQEPQKNGKLESRPLRTCRSGATMDILQRDRMLKRTHAAVVPTRKNLHLREHAIAPLL